MTFLLFNTLLNMKRDSEWRLQNSEEKDLQLVSRVVKKHQIVGVQTNGATVFTFVKEILSEQHHAHIFMMPVLRENSCHFRVLGCL